MATTMNEDYMHCGSASEASDSQQPGNRYNVAINDAHEDLQDRGVVNPMMMELDQLAEEEGMVVANRESVLMTDYEEVVVDNVKTGMVADNVKTGMVADNVKSDITSPRSVDVPEFQEHVPYLRDTTRTKYEEAAIYVQEGETNESFASHPNGRYSKVAFNIAHHPAFYITDFIATCLLMLLAIIEFPSLIFIPIKYRQIVVVLHGVVEFILLTYIGVGIVLRLIWMKPKTFIQQRTMIIAVVMLLMYFEAMVVLYRQKNHFRITRCLRPIFFIDTYLVFGVRRVLRQIIQCLKPIFDVMVLLFFLMGVFALMGYYLFADIDSAFFDTYLKSFVSLFITLTTANHPTVFMGAYLANRFSPLFFVVYLIITLYFFSSVLLAVVYAQFTCFEKIKFKELFLHKREALKLAYYVLTKDGVGVDYHDFMIFMFHYKPRIPEYQVMCMYKALQQAYAEKMNEPLPEKTEEPLCLEEFSFFYEIENFNWKIIKDDNKVWHEKLPSNVAILSSVLKKIIRFKYFNSIIGVVIIFNTLYLVLLALASSYNCSSNGDGSDRSVDDPFCKNRFSVSKTGLAGSFLFTLVYVIEILLRILGMGPFEYFGKQWNRLDFVLIFVSFIALCVEAGVSPGSTLSYLVILRPLKLIRILRMKKRYKSIMNTVFLLGYRLISVLLLLVVIFYFYAIIGMEIFHGKVFVGCCENALYGVPHDYASNGTELSSIYWLNNFDNIYQSYIILYEEMVVNNWFIMMEAYVSETTLAARLYFFAFWVTTTICLSVVIAYIVETFVFRVQNNLANTTCEVCNIYESTKEHTIVKLASHHIDTIKCETTVLNEAHTRNKSGFSINMWIRNWRRIDFDQIPSQHVIFHAKRQKTRDDLNLLQFNKELDGWIDEQTNKLIPATIPPNNKLLRYKLVNCVKEFLLLFLE